MDFDFETLKNLLGETTDDGGFKLKKGTKDALKKGAALIGGRRERRRAQEELEAGLAERRSAFEEQFGEGKKAYEKQLEMLRNMPDMTQASRDAIQAQKETAEEKLRRAEERTDQQRADVVGALQSGDPRATAGLLSALDKINLSEDQLRTQALGEKAGADMIGANLAEQNKQFKTALEKQLMDRAGMSADEARKALLDINTAEEAAGAKAQASGDQTALALDAMLREFDYGNPGKRTDSGSEDDGEREYGGKIRYEDGGYMGEEGFKTKGDFDHDTNKKAVIDEENGEKEAELTGGEVVFNPEQTETMEEIIADGDADKLLKFMKDLLSKPQFQD